MQFTTCIGITRKIDQNSLVEQIKQIGFSTEISIPTSSKGSLIVHYKDIPVVSPFFKDSLLKTTKALENKLTDCLRFSE